MRTTLLAASSIFLLSSLLHWSGPARADAEEGFAAFEAGDYQKAYDEWLPLAESGDVYMQFFVGYLLCNRCADHTLTG